MEDACYDLADGQIQGCAELDRLAQVTFPGHIQQGIVGSMRRVLSLISKTHLRLSLEPRLTDLDHLIDLFDLVIDVDDGPSDETIKAALQDEDATDPGDRQRPAALRLTDLPKD